MTPDGAYFRPYWLPVDPVTTSTPQEDIKGEDISHAGLTSELPLALENQVFSKEEDLPRFAKTVLLGFGRLGDGILLRDITGNPKSNPELVCLPARWLRLRAASPEIRDKIVPYYLNYVATPGPCDLAHLILWGKP